jgi:hypothetical protein
MKITSRTAFFPTLILSTVLGAWSAPPQSAPASSPERASNEKALQSFAALQPIDAHVHVFKTDPAFQAMLERLHLTLLNILVVDDTLPYRKQWKPQVDDALALMRSSHGHVALCTTFDPYKFNATSFSAVRSSNSMRTLQLARWR